jgi:hypothetical protein
MPIMKPLVGLLLVLSGMILGIPPVYEALTYVNYDGWPIVQVALGVSCIVVGLVFLVYRPRKKLPKGVVQVG